MTPMFHRSRRFACLRGLLSSIKFLRICETDFDATRILTTFRAKSPNTSKQMVWPKFKAIEALKTEGSKEELARPFGFQLRKSLASACDIAMFESVHVDDYHFSRAWVEWANPFLWCWLRALLEFGTIRLGFSTCDSEIQLATAG